MANHIKAINKTSVHKICSGQVVLSLAIAIKELVENSLDAGATVIDVRLKEYGSELIEVSDNGSGVLPDNFEGLTLKHHTSKLREFSDIFSVETFGFRGEALSSLCALSDLSVLTRHESQNCGTSLVFDHNGQIVGKTQCARQVGTTVTLSNLFSTLPVRHKEFLRNLKREFNKMTQLLYAYCLVSTGVKNKERLPPAEALEELNIDKEVAKMFRLEGYISTCKHGEGRSTNDRQFYYINSRPCEPPKVMKTVTEVYHQFNMHQSPFVYLNISVAREAVDVNVTPDKRQIFLDHEKLLIATIKASLVALYESVPSTFTVNSIQQKVIGSRNEINDEPKTTLSLLSQWRHKLDSEPTNKKRCLESNNKLFTRTAKQLKLDSKFSFVSSLNQGGIVSEEENGQESMLKKDDSFSIDSQDFKASEEVEEENSITLNSGEIKDETEITMSITEEKLVESTKDHENEWTTKVHKNIDVESSEGGINESERSQLVTLVKNEPQLTENITSDNHVSSQDPFFPPESMKTDSQSMSELSGKMIEYDTTPTMATEQNKCVTIKMDMDLLHTAFKIRSEKSKNEKKSLKIKFRAAIDPTKNSQAEQELNREISKDMFSQMKVIGQFNLGFIITKLGSDLFIIDQHATDEKYNFETLQKTTTISNQVLVVPQKLELTAVNESILIENIEVFKKNGFEFKIDEAAPVTQKISLTSVPMSRNYVFGKEDIDELLFMLQDSPNTLCRPSRVRAMFASRACRKSVMIGTALSKQEMRRLVDHMGEIEQPWNCPHGRPTMRHLVNLDLIR